MRVRRWEEVSWGSGGALVWSVDRASADPLSVDRTSHESMLTHEFWRLSPQTYRRRITQQYEGTLETDLGFVIAVRALCHPIHPVKFFHGSQPQTSHSLQPTLLLLQVMKLQDQDIKAGRIEYETGSVEVEVAFTVLLFRPFRNEIIDAQVTTVTEVR